MRYVSVTSLLSGLILMALSFIWPSLVREQLVKKNTAEVVRAHEAMGIMHSSTSNDDARDQARLERHKALGIVNARIRQRDITVVTLRVVGVVLAVVGIAAYIRGQNQLAE